MFQERTCRRIRRSSRGGPAWLRASCSPHALEQTRHFVVILDARRRFHAAGDIDRIRTHEADGGDDVFGRESAGKEERFRTCVGRQQRPVESPPCSATATPVEGGGTG